MKTNISGLNDAKFQAKTRMHSIIDFSCILWKESLISAGHQFLQYQYNDLAW
jgi:hypothetical protein